MRQAVPLGESLGTGEAGENEKDRPGTPTGTQCERLNRKKKDITGYTLEGHPNNRRA